jgi:hypothetical protein
MDDRRRALRERVTNLMEDAERSLEPPHAPAVRYGISRFHDLVDRDQLEAAWDELSEVGVAADGNPAFWRNLADAAGALGLEERRVEAARRARTAR